MKWMTQAEFARKEGVSRTAILLAVRSGRLRTNGKTGKACRIDSECTLASSRINIPADPKQRAEYQALRTQKLLAEIEAENYRNEQKYNEMLRQVSEKQFELYSAAFAPVKDNLINLHLNSEQYATLRSLIEKAMNDFRQAVSDWNNSLK